MASSLFDLSLNLILNEIKHGTIHYVHMLPPNLSQLVLDTALERRLIDDPKCLKFLTSIEFLTGMTSISIQIDSIYRYGFFRCLRESITARLPNGKTVDAAITKLDLSDFYCYLLEENGACKRVLENLIELSMSNWTDVLNSQRPIVSFNQLTILKLEKCGIDINVWPEFLRKLPTVKYLQMIDVSIGGDLETEILDKFLPFPMPHLKSLEISGKYRRQRFNCNKVFIDNLIGCPELGKVHLMLDESSTDEANLIRLANMDIIMKIKARFVVSGYENTDSVPFDSSSKFKVVRIFHKMIDSIDLSFSGEWKPHFSTALEDMVTTCLNLTTFSICINNAAISKEDMNRINAALVRYFGKSERALRLKNLRLRGDFDEAVVSAVFEKCLNLVQLDISSRHK